MLNGGTLKTWDVKQLLGSSPSNRSLGIILLNQPIAPAHEDTVKQLWERGECFVDGSGCKDRS